MRRKGWAPVCGRMGQSSGVPGRQGSGMARGYSEGPTGIPMMGSGLRTILTAPVPAALKMTPGVPVEEYIMHAIMSMRHTW